MRAGANMRYAVSWAPWSSKQLLACMWGATSSNLNGCNCHTLLHLRHAIGLCASLPDSRDMSLTLLQPVLCALLVPPPVTQTASLQLTPASYTWQRLFLFTLASALCLAECCRLGSALDCGLGLCSLLIVPTVSCSGGACTRCNNMLVADICLPVFCRQNA